MKKTYMKPIMMGERFMANTYVAACYKIKCTTPNGNDSYTHLYNDTNGNGQLDDADELLYSRSNGFFGCNKWHKGVIQDEAPAVNGFVKKTVWSWGSKTDVVEPVYWWNESLGASSDYHVMTPGKENYETNPNAS